MVAKLVRAADEETMLAEVAAGFEKLAADPEALAAYRAESEEVESSFDAPTPSGRAARQALSQAPALSRTIPRQASAAPTSWIRRGRSRRTRAPSAIVVTG